MNKPVTSATKEASVCDSCPRAFECGKLTMALTVIEGERQANSPTDERLQEFLETLAATGYAYPDSHRACALVHCPEPVREMTDWAIGILTSRRRGRIQAS